MLHLKQHKCKKINNIPENTYHNKTNPAKKPIGCSRDHGKMCCFIHISGNIIVDKLQMLIHHQQK